MRIRATSVGSRQGAVADPDLDGVEVAGRFQAPLDRRHGAALDGRPDRDLRDPQHLGVRHHRVPVDTDLANDGDRPRRRRSAQRPSRLPRLKKPTGRRTTPDARPARDRGRRLERPVLLRLTDADAGLHVGLAVGRVAALVGRLVGPVGQRRRHFHVQPARQPHPLERLEHRHRRPHGVDTNEPRGRQEVEPHVVERVPDDLVLPRIHPQRHQRGLVHLALDVGLELALAAALLAAPPVLRLQLSRRLLVILAAEEPRGVVLDLQDLMPLERLAPGQVVIARLELEVHEVDLRHEPRLGRDAAGAGRFVRVPFVALRLAAAAFGARHPLPPPHLAPQPVVLVPHPLRFGDDDAVEPEGTADVDAVAHEPGVVPHRTVEPDPARTEDLELLLFIEDVVVQDLTVDVAARQHALHERVEFGRRRGLAGLGGRRGHAQRERGRAREQQTDRHQGPPLGRAGRHDLDELP